jgi:hypothetical protein
MKDGRVRRIRGAVLLLGLVSSALPVRADDEHHKYLPLIADAKSVSLIGHGNFDPSSLVEEVFEAARILNKTRELKLVVHAHPPITPHAWPLCFLNRNARNPTHLFGACAESTARATGTGGGLG